MNCCSGCTENTPLVDWVREIAIPLDRPIRVENGQVIHAQQGIGCDGLTGWPFGLAGLAELDLPPNQAGASFELGVELNGWDVLTDLSNWTMAGLLDEVRLAVQQGGFVQVPAQVFSLTGITSWNPFIVIKGRAAYAHSSASHLRDAILSAVATVVGYNAGSVRFEADTYDPTTGQTHTDPAKRRYDAPVGGGTTPPPDIPKPFEWPEFIKTLANELNIKPASAFGILIGGGLLGLLMVKKAL